MIGRIATAGLCMTALAGCTTDNLRTALGTPKNPTAIFSRPTQPRGKAPTQEDFITPLYEVLRRAAAKTPADVKPEDMRRYLGAGFALSDIYCTNFFAKTDEAYRRRRFGRTLTNDVGTAMSTVLGLAKAGESVVTGVAAAVGLADSGWRNYDDSFVVSPELSNVQSLVFAAQDNFRARTLAKTALMPADYGTAQSVILRYSNVCSFLSMKSLLDQSAGEQRRDLNTKTQALTEPARVPKAPKPGTTTSEQAAEAVSGTQPETATPIISVNRAAEGSSQ